MTQSIKTCLPAMALAVSALMAPAAQAQDKLTLQLKWVTQAQFAGYYVAKTRASTKTPGWT